MGADCVRCTYTVSRLIPVVGHGGRGVMEEGAQNKQEAQSFDGIVMVDA